MRRSTTLAAAAFALGAASAAFADTYTYRYVGPTFVGGTDHVEISFTTSAPLAPNTSYMDAATAGVISSSVTVVGPNGVVNGFTLPVTTFQLHTNATAGTAAPGIDAWDVMGDASNLAGTTPTMTGTHFQAYTMNTLLFIPGSDIPGATNLVTGNYNYDQATETTFYASCTGIAGCTLAGNGQPYVGNYSGIVNPSGTSGANWTIAVNATTPPAPPPAPLAVSGTLPNGTAGAAYSSAALSASGGVAPYTWVAAGLPAGLAIDVSTGLVSGTPTSAGTYSFTVTVTDAAQSTLAAAESIVIDAPVATPVACSGTNAPISGVNKWWLDVNGGLAGGGQSVVYTPTPAGTTFTGGTTGFAVGELIDYAGTVDGAGMCAATSMTVKPAPAPGYSCTKPANAKSAHSRNRITAVGDGYIVVGNVRVEVPSCATISWNGAQGFAIGQRAEYEGYSINGVTVAQKITIN